MLLEHAQEAKATVLDLFSRKVERGKGHRLAVGIGWSAPKRTYAVAIRAQYPYDPTSLFNDPRLLDCLDFRVVRPVMSHSFDGDLRVDQLQVSHRPIRIGGSIGVPNQPGGSIGAFVSARQDGNIRLLTANHVLTPPSQSAGGAIAIQPGHSYGGIAPRDRVGTVGDCVPLRSVANRMDAGLVNLDCEFDFLPTLGPIVLSRHVPTHPTDLLGSPVLKLGPVTGLTRGTISVVELDSLQVGFPDGPRIFDGQIEISGATAQFSAFGDSGSLVASPMGGPIGLLFAGCDNRSYASPLRSILDALDVNLLTRSGT